MVKYVYTNNSPYDCMTRCKELLSHTHSEIWLHQHFLYIIHNRDIHQWNSGGIENEMMTFEMEFQLEIFKQQIICYPFVAGV